MSTLLHDQCVELLWMLRARRGFNPQRYVAAKVLLLNSYFRQSGLKAAVLGVSGGIDSAVVAGLLAAAAREADSPIELNLAALLPYFIKEGTTNQDSATAHGAEVASAFGMKCVEIDLSASHVAMKASADTALGVTGDAWASGQLVSYLRTPALYYLTSLLTQQGFPALVAGTTNRDEGGYIGYICKAGDGMNDIQVISDLHKSEVFAVGRLLGVPDSVLNAEPSGDIYDGRTDEQLIGVPYDFIELYQLYLTLLSATEQKSLMRNLSTGARSQFDQWSKRLTTLNRQNAHKYLGGSPAVHLDIYPRAVPGGWRVESDAEPIRIDSSKFVNLRTVDPSFIHSLQMQESEQRTSPRPGAVTREDLPGFGESGFLLHGVLSDAECALLRAELDKQEWQPVGLNGMVKDYNPERGDAIGSWRASYYSDSLARTLWNRIAPSFPILRIMNEDTPTDWNGDPVWRAVGISSLMRFIRYEEQGLLVPHYDAPYDYHEGKRTLMSMVLYLSQSRAEDGGATRFLIDPQRHLPLCQRDYSDRHELACDEEVALKVMPRVGSALIFDHRLLHDGEAITGRSQKIIMRTDIIFERCGLQLQKQVTVSRPLGLPEQTY